MGNYYRFVWKNCIGFVWKFASYSFILSHSTLLIAVPVFCHSSYWKFWIFVKLRKKIIRIAVKHICSIIFIYLIYHIFDISFVILSSWASQWYYPLIRVLVYFPQQKCIVHLWSNVFEGIKKVILSFHVIIDHIDVHHNIKYCLILFISFVFK